MGETQIVWSADDGANEAMAVMASTLLEAERDGFAYCKECGLKVYGEDVSDILESLGSHSPCADQLAEQADKG